MKRAARTQHHCLTVTHLGQLVDTTLVERRSRAPQGSRAQGSSAPGRQGTRSETHLGASVTSTQTNDSDMAGPPTRVSWEVTCPRPARVLPPIHTYVCRSGPDETSLERRCSTPAHGEARRTAVQHRPTPQPAPTLESAGLLQACPKKASCRPAAHWLAQRPSEDSGSNHNVWTAGLASQI